MGESRSVGINDDSVVNNADELRRQVAWIEREFQQAALVEDFMPGDEFTTLVLGNGPTRQCLPGLVSVEAKHYGRHKVLRADLRGVGLTKISRPPRAATRRRSWPSRPPMRCAASITCASTSRPTRRARCASWK